MAPDDNRLMRDQKFARACMNLARSDGWNDVLAELTNQLMDIRESNDSLEGTALYRNQGRALFITDFLKRAETPDVTMARIAAAASRRVRRNMQGKSGSPL